MSKFSFNGSIATTAFSGTGESSGETFMGQFQFKCFLSPYDRVRADSKRRELIGSVNPHLASQQAQDIAFALSELMFRVVDAPDFFKNREINGGHLDHNVLIDIINLAIEAEEEFQKQQTERLEATQKRLANAIRKKKIKKEEVEDTPIEAPEEKVTEIDLG